MCVQVWNREKFCHVHKNLSSRIERYNAMVKSEKLCKPTVTGTWMGFLVQFFRDKLTPLIVRLLFLNLFLFDNSKNSISWQRQMEKGWEGLFLEEGWSFTANRRGCSCPPSSIRWTTSFQNVLIQDPLPKKFMHDLLPKCFNARIIPKCFNARPILKKINAWPLPKCFGQ